LFLDTKGSAESRLKALCAASIRGVDPKLVEMILAEVVPRNYLRVITRK
jgi:hypothetical protein